VAAAAAAAAAAPIAPVAVAAAAAGRGARTAASPRPSSRVDATPPNRSTRRRQKASGPASGPESCRGARLRAAAAATRRTRLSALAARAAASPEEQVPAARSASCARRAWWRAVAARMTWAARRGWSGRRGRRGRRLGTGPAATKGGPPSARQRNQLGLLILDSVRTLPTHPQHERCTGATPSERGTTHRQSLASRRPSEKPAAASRTCRPLHQGRASRSRQPPLNQHGAVGCLSSLLTSPAPHGLVGAPRRRQRLCPQWPARRKGVPATLQIRRRGGGYHLAASASEWRRRS